MQLAAMRVMKTCVVETKTACLFAAPMCLLLGTVYFLHPYYLLVYDRTTSEPEFDDAFDFPFLSARHGSSGDCRQLFVDTAVANFTLSADYQASVKRFEEAIAAALKRQSFEGHSHQLPSMYLTMHFLASQPRVRHVCETGFNLGHSSFNFLTANRQLIVHSFDLGSHRYAHSMAEFMSKQFPGRFFVHFGDSTKTVPDFIRSDPDYRCDLLYVDGGHTYNVALADMMNFASAANVENGALIVFDDYPSVMFELGVAWEDIRRWGYVRESMRCFYPNDRNRGFTIGRVVKRPSIEWSRKP